MRWIDPETSFSRQLSTVFLLGIICLAFISSGFISYASYHRDQEHYRQLVLEISNNLVRSIQSERDDPLRVAPRLMQQALGFSSLLQVSLFDEDFRPIAVKSADGKQRNVFGWQGVRGTSAQYVGDSKTEFHFAAPLYSDDSSLEPVGYVLLVFNKPRLTAIIEEFFLENVIVMTMLAVIFIVLLRHLVARMTRPLENFSSLMIQAEKGEQGMRADFNNSIELATMTHSFNEMMTMLEQRTDQLTASRDQAMSMAKIKSDFAANVSHEIRTPLNGILGMINLLKEMGLPQHQQEYLDVASKSGDSLLMLINDVLDFSKIESGNYDLDIQTFDLRQSIEQMAMLYAEKVQVKDLEMCLVIPADFPPQVKGDAVRLRQVISNLLNNAIKFTDHGQITLQLTELSRAGDTGLFEFEVIDTGIGIPVQAQAKIFDPFGQVDSSSSTKYGGTGLGLTIVTQLVTLMGGEIAVDSQPGKGSRFSFVLPMPVIDVPQGQDERSHVELQGKRVLLVEPFDTNSQYLADMFEFWGMDYQLADSLNEARLCLGLDSEDRHRLDYCLFSLNVAGQELMEFVQLFQQGPYADTHLIAMMRFGLTISAFDLDRSLVSASLDRPIRFDALRHTLRDLTLSTEQKQQQPEADVAGKIPQLAGLEVLVVDDIQTNLLVAKAMLKELGIVADAVTNGLEAVDFFNEKPYDLILMDCNMPIMDGYEATRRIRNMGKRGQDVAIIALTAKDKQSDRDACLDVGMNDYVLKPFELNLLVEKIQSVLGQSRVLTAQSSRMSDEVSGGREIMSDQIFDTLVLHTGNSIRGIVDSYLIDTPIYISTLMAAMEAGDRDKILELAHKIKGSSRNIGAMSLVGVCQEIEKSWAEDRIDEAEIKALIDDLDDVFKQTEMQLNTKVAQADLHEEVLESSTKAIVLIVDDDRSTRMTVSNVLEREGLQTEFGSNGREAVTMFELLRPNIVIMDALMPIKDGFQACREIKALPNGDITPVLITTALENERSVNMAFEAGAADFIPKPINLSVLRQRVRRLLKNQASERHVHKLAFNDVLTGLPNRFAFTEHLVQELDHAKRMGELFSVMFIDLDQFKIINDTLGHDAGDELLKALTGRLSNCIRRGDMLARLGGDEFVVVLSHLNERETAGKVADKMLNALTRPFSIAGNDLFAGVSIGIAIYPDDGEDKDNLLKNADTAMYKAKASGRNNYQYYTREMSEILADRMRLESELRKVVNDQELSLYFQPKYDVERGQVVGSEALVRWQHWLKGTVSPDEFIPLSEETGLIHDIGMWVLKTACESMCQWQSEHDYRGSVAVNVSAVQLADDSFVSQVSNCLAETGLDPAYLELEITESIIMDDTDQVIRKLHKLRDMGIRLSIDDFGTGYSSFNYLKQLPVHTLKLDRDFICDIPNNKADMAVVDGLITLAHNLGLEVVAEGIEEQDQFNFLKDHGCDLIQGFLISKPLEMQEFVAIHVARTEDSQPLNWLSASASS